MERIRRFITTNKRKIAFGAIVFFVASLSFGLGYTAARQFNHTPIVIEQCHS